MCLIFFSLNQHPDYKLILAGNRDEFYARQTAQADFWSYDPTIIGGRDLEAVMPNGACGTWMGMTKTGKLAFITNYRDPKNINPNAPSRGHLVSNFLFNDIDGYTYLQQLEPLAVHYNGFNLVVGNVDSLFYLSNYQDRIQKLESGLFGLSNHLLDTPWPKVLTGKAAMEKILANKTIDAESLFTILQNEQQAPDDQLPNTGIGLERERALSSMFIKTAGYGTRCSTVILIKKNGEVCFQERTYDLGDFSFTTRHFEFTISH